jgi:hypothetical protein
MQESDHEDGPAREALSDRVRPNHLDKLSRNDKLSKHVFTAAE